MTVSHVRGSHLVRRPGESGTVAVEAAIVAPALVVLMLLVVFAGRVSEANGNVERAASEGARAASLHQNPTAARKAAIDSASANLAASGTKCTSIETVVDTSELQPGGRVTVDVRCTASMADVALLGVPGTRTFRAHAVEVVDRYRSDP